MESTNFRASCLPMGTESRQALARVAGTLGAAIKQPVSFLCMNWANAHQIGRQLSDIAQKKLTSSLDQRGPGAAQLSTGLNSRLRGRSRKTGAGATEALGAVAVLVGLAGVLSIGRDGDGSSGSSSEGSAESLSSLETARSLSSSQGAQAVVSIAAGSSGRSNVGSGEQRRSEDGGLTHIEE